MRRGPGIRHRFAFPNRNAGLHRGHPYEAGLQRLQRKKARVLDRRAVRVKIEIPLRLAVVPIIQKMARFHNGLRGLIRRMSARLPGLFRHLIVLTGGLPWDGLEVKEG